MRTSIRNDQYTLEIGDRSRLEIPVGEGFKAKYDHMGRLRLEVAGVPKWDGKQGRLELYDDELEDQFRAIQPVTTDNSRQDSPQADETAALDIGANNIVACTTTTGQQYLCEGRDLFERLYEAGVSTVYVGDLTDVLDTHLSVRANAKTHNFWAFCAFIDRLACTAEEYGITVEVRPEAWTSQTCPQCGSTEDTTRHQDTLTCPCGFEGHADLIASEAFLRRHQNSKSSDCRTRHEMSRQRHETDIPRPIERPVRFEWNDHDWSEIPHSHDSPKEARTDQSTPQPA